MSYRTRRRNPRVCGYELGAELGYGAFGRVVYATHVETGNEVAVKIISKRRSEVVNVMARREINILRSVSHEHIVRLEDSFEDDSHFYLVFEL
ncbi:hypothetical protein EV182_001024 [Spiromyces aspiralis]|uniref:Uncharacterized protein n=1 Tax=Spiromyces aspiralis TaxID=68401 RepID=A0ACC1HKA3_9FUNG|nr:hypothetical protein EV182_001024 [Spiromyces aspiralis]